MRCDGQDRPGAGPVPVGRAAPDAADLPALCRCGRPAVHRRQPGTGVAVRPGSAPAGRAPRRGGPGRPAWPGRPGPLRRGRPGPGHGGADVLHHRDRARAGRLRTGRQARPELEDLGPAAFPGPAAPAGHLVPALHGRPPVPDGPLPDRTSGCLGPLAAVQRTRGEHGHHGRPSGRPLDPQRPQAVHQQRLRRQPLRRLRQHEPLGGPAAGHEQLPGPARHARPPGHPVQRDRGRPLHEQRRDRLRGLPCARRSSAGGRRRTGSGRRLLPARQDHPGREEPGYRHRRVRRHCRVRPAAGPGRPDPDQASGRRGPGGRDGDQARGGQRAAALRGPRGRREPSRRHPPVRHGQGLRVPGDPAGLPARRRTTRRLRRDAGGRGREVLPRRRRVPAHGRHRGRVELQDRQGTVPRHRRRLRRPGVTRAGVAGCGCG